MFRPTMILIASMLLTSIGCGGGSGRFPIKGTVVMAGKPLSYGLIKFFKADQLIGTASIQTDGSFIATDMVPGVVTATVDTRDQNVLITLGKQGAKLPIAGDKKAAPAAAPMPNPFPSTVTPDLLVANKIPLTYADPKTSKLAYTITGKNQSITIELK